MGEDDWALISLALWIIGGLIFFWPLINTFFDPRTQSSFGFNNIIWAAIFVGAGFLVPFLFPSGREEHRKYGERQARSRAYAEELRRS